MNELNNALPTGNNDDHETRQREIERLRREAAAARLEADMLEAETEVLIATGQLEC